MIIDANKSVTSIVLIIDDDMREAENARQFLGKAVPNSEIEFIIQSPDEVSNVSEYLSLLNSFPVSAVLIDHRLGESSSAPYTGLELANTLRSVQSMLPIFILTKWAKADSLEEQGFVVDDVMDKALLRQHAAAYAGRLLRAMRRYEEARSQQSRRMHELVSESLRHELSNDETDELIRLRAEIGIGSLGREIEMAEETRRRLENKKEVLEALKKLIEEE